MKGHFYKKSTKTYIPRYHCHECKRSFSTRTLSPTFNQKRSDLNPQIFKLLCAGVAMREIARVLGCNYKTVYLKFLWLGKRAQEFHFKQKLQADTVFFDEMESIEHTKLKPLTIALAVSDQYQILGVKVGTIPAKGHLAGIAYRKYGYRKNESLIKTKELLTDLKHQLRLPVKAFKSDAKPTYKDALKKIFPEASYEQFLSRDNKEKRREQKYLKLELNLYLYIAKANQYRFL